MKRILFGIMIVSLAALLSISFATARDDEKPEKKNKASKERWNCNNWDLECSDECFDLDFSGLEGLRGLEGLKGLEEGLKGLEVGMEALHNVELDFNFDGLSESLEALGMALEHTDIPPTPPIALPLPPPVPPIPPIDTDYFAHFFWDWDDHIESEDLTEEEELRLHALSALWKMDPDELIPVLEKILKGEEHPAIRSKALSILRNIDDERVVPILAGVAKDDPDMRVRKRAIYYLGKSVDKRALKVLEEILEE